MKQLPMWETTEAEVIPDDLPPTPSPIGVQRKHLPDIGPIREALWQWAEQHGFPAFSWPDHGDPKWMTTLPAGEASWRRWCTDGDKSNTRIMHQKILAQGESNATTSQR